MQQTALCGSGICQWNIRTGGDWINYIVQIFIYGEVEGRTNLHGRTDGQMEARVNRT